MKDEQELVGKPLTEETYVAAWEARQNRAIRDMKGEASALSKAAEALGRFALDLVARREHESRGG